MTLKTSFITLIVGSALALVPSAFGAVPEIDGNGAVGQLTQGLEATYNAEQAAIGRERAGVFVRPSDRSVALDRMYGLGAFASTTSDRSVALDRMYGLGEFAPVRDAHDRVGPVSEPVSTPTVTSGRDVEWPQIGIGLGVGLLLAAGLFIAMRTTRIRPLAH